MTEITDEMILEKAREIQEDRGGSLTDAMISAEEALAPKPSIPESFTIEIKVKPRVARWIMQEFGGHAKFSIEHRLGAYLETVLNRSRMMALRAAEEPPEITDGGAVTMTRQNFMEKAPKA